MVSSPFSALSTAHAITKVAELDIAYLRLLHCIRASRQVVCCCVLLSASLKAKSVVLDEEKLVSVMTGMPDIAQNVSRIPHKG